MRNCHNKRLQVMAGHYYSEYCYRYYSFFNIVTIITIIDVITMNTIFNGPLPWRGILINPAHNSCFHIHIRPVPGAAFESSRGTEAQERVPIIWRIQ